MMAAVMMIAAPIAAARPIAMFASRRFWIVLAIQRVPDMGRPLPPHRRSLRTNIPRIDVVVIKLKTRRAGLRRGSQGQVVFYRSRRSRSAQIVERARVVVGGAPTARTGVGSTKSHFDFQGRMLRTCSMMLAVAKVVVVGHHGLHSQWMMTAVEIGVAVAVMHTALETFAPGQFHHAFPYAAYFGNHCKWMKAENACSPLKGSLSLILGKLA
mmetsp:Transcript_28134/g.58613  ORF Transcript_28134/g.58613 Transcript_28134/m.58613 type:complete len:212 (+) Transcript_28134:378-1013(+)